MAASGSDLTRQLESRLFSAGDKAREWIYWSKFTIHSILRGLQSLIQDKSWWLRKLIDIDVSISRRLVPTIGLWLRVEWWIYILKAKARICTLWLVLYRPKWCNQSLGRYSRRGVSFKFSSRHIPADNNCAALKNSVCQYS